MRWDRKEQAHSHVWGHLRQVLFSTVVSLQRQPFSSMSPLHRTTPTEGVANLSGAGERSMESAQLTHRYSYSSGTGADVEMGARHSKSVRETEHEQRTPFLGSTTREIQTQDARENGDGSRAHNASTGPLSEWLDSREPRLKFTILVSLVIVFMGMHNILQETLMKTSGFSFGWALAMLEAVGVLAGSFLERFHEGSHMKMVAPFKNYVLLAGLLVMSSSLSNISLNYINYPTKVIFRSCKLIPTMVIALVWRKKALSRWEFAAAGAVCTGLVIFTRKDAKLQPDFNPIGIGMVSLSVCADAFLPNLQEHLFLLGASRVEVTFFTNSLAVLGMLVSTIANGNLLEFLQFVVENPNAIGKILLYVMLSHVAIASHMMVVKEYGGVTAVLVGNTRKAMTITLSFIVYHREEFTYRHVLGGALVLGGVAANVIMKDRRRKAVPRLANKAETSVDKAESGRRRSGVDVSAGRIRVSNGNGMDKKLDSDGAAVEELVSASRLGGLGWSEQDKTTGGLDCSDGGRGGKGGKGGGVRVGSGERNAQGMNGDRLTGSRDDVCAVSCGTYQ